MNLYTEVNSFYDWLETNPMATSDIVLWHALMHVANKAGWPDKFAVAVSVLQLKTGLKKDAICDARNRLAQKGRLQWEQRKGNQSAIYWLIPFVSVKTTQLPTQPPTQPPTQLPTINILDNTRLEEDEVARKIAGEMYQKEIGVVSPLMAEKLFMWVDDYGSDWVVNAIKEAVVHNARTPAYIEAVLKSWKTNGFKVKYDKCRNQGEVLPVL